MNPDIPVVRDLQEVDNRIRELTAEVARLPKYIAEIQRKLDSHKRQIEEQKAALAENHKQRRLYEAKAGDQQQKASRLREQMNEAKTNAQYRAFQHEISYLETEISKLEDRILDAMEEAETLEANVAKAQQELEAETAEVEKEIAATRDRVARDEEELVKFRKRREELTGKLSPETLRTYERVLRSRGGVAVAAAGEDRCLECNVMLRPHFQQRLRAGDELMVCETCGVLLYYPPAVEQKLEDPAGESNVGR